MPNCCGKSDNKFIGTPIAISQAVLTNTEYSTAKIRASGGIHGRFCRGRVFGTSQRHLRCQIAAE
jgi:hypothetical protein